MITVPKCSVLMGCLLSLILSGCANSQQFEQAVLEGDAHAADESAGSWRPDVVTVQLLDVSMLNSDGDDDGTGGELQVFVILTSSTGVSAEMHFPNTGADYYPVNLGQMVRMGMFMQSFDRLVVGESLNLNIWFVDSDNLSDAGRATISQVANGLTQLMPNSGRWGDLRAAMETGISGANELLDWYEQSDFLGGYSLALSSDNQWGISAPQVVTSDNGNIRLTYQILGSLIPATASPASQVQANNSIAPIVTEPSLSLGLVELPGRVVFAVNDDYSQETYIYQMQSGEMTDTQLTPYGFTRISNPVFSPDGQIIAFTGVKDARTQIYILENGEISSPIPNASGRQDDPSWQPNSHNLAYTLRFSQGEQTLQIVDIYDTTTDRILWDDSGDVLFPDWSEDNVLYVIRTLTGQNRLEVKWNNGRVVSLMNTDRTHNLYAPKWSPTGDLIAFVMSQGESQGQSLYIYNLDTGEALPVITMRSIQFPVWSPSGDQILLLGDVGSGKRLYILNVASGQLMTLQSEEIQSNTVYGIDWAAD